jgi:hypothetical protein
MKNQKNDHVSSFVKVIIDRVHGGRKQDRKFWDRKIENPRNDLGGFSNGEIPIEQQEGFAQTLKQARAKRAVFLLGILLLCFVFALVYSRPNLFPFLSYSKIYQSISEYFPEKYEAKNQIKAVAPKPLEEPVASRTAKKEYTFSEEQIARAKFNVENEKKQNPLSTSESYHIRSGKLKRDSLSKSFKDYEHRYEIEFLSGRRFYADSIIVTDDMVTFENKRGLIFSVSKNEVKTMKRLN